MHNRQRLSIAQAVAHRDRGRGRLRATTAVAGVAGVAMTGLVSLVLPGSAHKSGAPGSGAGS